MKINNNIQYTCAVHLYDIVIFFRNTLFLYMSFGKFSYYMTHMHIVHSFHDLTNLPFNMEAELR